MVQHLFLTKRRKTSVLVQHTQFHPIQAVSRRPRLMCTKEAKAAKCGLVLPRGLTLDLGGMVGGEGLEPPTLSV